MICPFCKKPIDPFSAVLWRQQKGKRRQLICPFCKNPIDI